jgi:hypothetical protein
VVNTSGISTKVLDGARRAGGGSIGVGCSTVSRSSPLGTSRMAFHCSFNQLKEFLAGPRVLGSAEILEDL